MAKRHRLGWLGPILVLIGVAAGGVAVWYFLVAQPKAGDVIDTIVLDDHSKLLIRDEAGGGPRDFVELYEHGALKWQALIPAYVGTPTRPAVAWSDRVITVRVERDGRAEVFAFLRETSGKLGALRVAKDKEPLHIHPEGPITLTDHVRSYELAGGPGWHEIVAVDLAKGEGVWKVKLGAQPITAGGLEDGAVWLEQAGTRRWFDAETGRERSAAQASKLPN